MSTSTSHFDLLSQIINCYLKEKQNYVFPFSFFSFAAAHFHLVSISSFSHRRFKTFQFFFQRNRSLFCCCCCCFFLSHALTLSLLSTSIQASKLKSKDCCCCCCCFCFYLKKFGKLCDLPPKRMGASKAKFHPGLHEWVDVLTEDFLRTQISQFHRLLNFLTQSAPLLDFMVVCLHSILSILNIFQNTYFIDTILFLFWFSLISDMI